MGSRFNNSIDGIKYETGDIELWRNCAVFSFNSALSRHLNIICSKEGLNLRKEGTLKASEKNFW
jgi:DNA polymerase III delta prime subunit